MLNYPDIIYPSNSLYYIPKQKEKYKLYNESAFNNFFANALKTTMSFGRSVLEWHSVCPVALTKQSWILAYCFTF